jgi:hypothetical protein
LKQWNHIIKVSVMRNVADVNQAHFESQLHSMIIHPAVNVARESRVAFISPCDLLGVDMGSRYMDGEKKQLFLIQSMEFISGTMLWNVCCNVRPWNV